MVEVDNADRLMKAAEAARYLGYTEGTLRNKAAAGEVPSVKLPGGALRFRRSALDAWMVEREAVNVPTTQPAA
ncbi:MAG: helix-turn-helix domain-containing protein [Vicinamibacterales bacterium]